MNIKKQNEGKCVLNLCSKIIRNCLKATELENKISQLEKRKLM